MKQKFLSLVLAAVATLGFTVTSASAAPSSFVDINQSAAWTTPADAKKADANVLMTGNAAIDKAWTTVATENWTATLLIAPAATALAKSTTVGANMLKAAKTPATAAVAPHSWVVIQPVEIAGYIEHPIKAWTVTEGAAKK